MLWLEIVPFQYGGVIYEVARVPLGDVATVPLVDAPVPLGDVATVPLVGVAPVPLGDVAVHAEPVPMVDSRLKYHGGWKCWVVSIREYKVTAKFPLRSKGASRSFDEARMDAQSFLKKLHDIIAEADALTVKQLSGLCGDVGVPRKGVKGALMLRYVLHMAQKLEEAAAAEFIAKVAAVPGNTVLETGEGAEMPMLQPGELMTENISDTLFVPGESDKVSKPNVIANCCACAPRLMVDKFKHACTNRREEDSLYSLKTTRNNQKKRQRQHTNKNKNKHKQT